MANQVNIIFPHQLFKESELINNGHVIYLIEEALFFTQYKFHKQKIAFHRATMKCYEDYLLTKGLRVYYIESKNELSDLLNFSTEVASKNIEAVHFINPIDDWLERKINKVFKECTLKKYESPNFLNSQLEVDDYFKKDKKSYFQTNFYKKQRKDYCVLLDTAGEPLGGKWTFDSENRKKYPKGKTPPAIHYPEVGAYWEEAVSYVKENFAANYGTIDKAPYYPVDFETSDTWLEQFLEYRFLEFGVFQDAIVKEEVFMHHSLLSPLINVGILSPKEVVDKTITYGLKNDIPMNSIEGFVRQIIGWREFIRGVYVAKGSFSRTRNFWNFKRKIPKSFYNGTTGIVPVDIAIKKALKTGYCHHIERLMVLGNFMLLCEFDPDEVYQWFMELFVDAYDWVMVPNVYGMSQFADGGVFATKPYISGSNYIKKMSNYGAGDWQEIWDGLFWNFIDKQSDYIKKNPRLSMMYRSFERLSPEKKVNHLENAAKFLERLDSQ
ncbi:cryptochrome/photolyase family protein [Wenyingzhuangia sp. IMCC45574]